MRKTGEPQCLRVDLLLLQLQLQLLLLLDSRPQKSRSQMDLSTCKSTEKGRLALPGRLLLCQSVILASQCPNGLLDWVQCNFYVIFRASTHDSDTQNTSDSRNSTSSSESLWQEHTAVRYKGRRRTTRERVGASLHSCLCRRLEPTRHTVLA